MGHNIFLLDISHLTEMDMVSFIKGEIVLSDNMEIPFSEPLEQLPQNDFPVRGEKRCVSKFGRSENI